MPTFGTASKAALAELHPLLQKLFNSAITEVDFKILDAQRGRAEQEKAFSTGHSKVHFGDSAHNYVPAVAADIFPAPYDWDNNEAFMKCGKIIMAHADKLKIPIRWGGGIPDKSFNWDTGHFELRPWRDYAKQGHLIKG